MRLRRGLALLGALVLLPLMACGGGDGFGCTGDTCKATFDGPGEQDLSSELGSGATVEVVTVAGYRVTLTEVDGEDVTLRVVGG